MTGTDPRNAYAEATPISAELLCGPPSVPAGRFARAALAYAAAGLAVFPVRPGGKAPLVRNGHLDASTDRDTICRWWHRWNAANVAIRPPEGVVVLDVDPRHGGDQTLADLVDRHGPLPTTLTCRTRSGGWHLWLSYAGRARGKLGEGIDVKTNRGYLVVPPSVHSSGGSYEWVETSSTAPAPAWLRALLASPTVLATRGFSGSRRIAGLLRVVAAAAEGERNCALYWAACRLFERGGNAGAVEQLVAAARSSGLEEREIRATIASAARTVRAS